MFQGTPQNCWVVKDLGISHCAEAGLVCPRRRSSGKEHRVPCSYPSCSWHWRCRVAQVVAYVPERRTVHHERCVDRGGSHLHNVHASWTSHFPSLWNRDAFFSKTSITEVCISSFQLKNCIIWSCIILTKHIKLFSDDGNQFTLYSSQSHYWNNCSSNLN